MALKSNAEFTITHTLSIRYYLTSLDEQRVERTLKFNGTIIAIENYNSMSKGGDLCKLETTMNELYTGPKQPYKCSCNTGKSPADCGYSFYVLFKSRLRLKFIKFKYRFAHLNIKNLIFCSKPAKNSGVNLE